MWISEFRRALFDWEKLRMIKFLVRLQDSYIESNQANHRVWKVAPGGEFSVSSCYSHVANHRHITGPWSSI